MRKVAVPTRVIRRAARLLAVVPVALVIASCSSPPPTNQLPTKPPLVGTDVPVGTYAYDGGFGVVATLTPQGETWILSVENTSSEPLGTPGLYALDATNGVRIDASVEGAHPLAGGTKGRFVVTFDGNPSTESMGLIMLEFGRHNFGPLAPGQEN